MYCPKCGMLNDDNAFRCVKCNEIIQPIAPPPPAARPKNIADDVGMRILLPVGRSPLAIVAGYLGLFSVLLVPAPLALLFGILAVVDIRKHPKNRGMGRAIFGIVMGAICSLLLGGVIVAWAFSPST